MANDELRDSLRTENHEYHREGDTFYKDGEPIDKGEYRLAHYNARIDVAIPGEGDSYRRVEVPYRKASRAGEIANFPDSDKTVEIEGRTYTAKEIADAFKRVEGGDPIRY